MSTAGSATASVRCRVHRVRDVAGAVSREVEVGVGGKSSQQRLTGDGGTVHGSDLEGCGFQYRGMLLPHSVKRVAAVVRRRHGDGHEPGCATGSAPFLGLGETAKGRCLRGGGPVDGCPPRAVMVPGGGEREGGERARGTPPHAGPVSPPEECVLMAQGFEYWSRKGVPAPCEELSHLVNDRAVRDNNTPGRRPAGADRPDKLAAGRLSGPHHRGPAVRLLCDAVSPSSKGHSPGAGTADNDGVAPGAGHVEDDDSNLTDRRREPVPGGWAQEGVEAVQGADP
jgi:hypothetical protein